MLIQANAFDIPLPDQSVHCVVTSPPYYGLRKYSDDQGDEPLGLEATPERHIERTVQWAREIKRILRDDGVFWLNYGDSYAGSGKGAANWDGDVAGKQATNKGSMADGSGLPVYRDLPGGNLMMLPSRIAHALQQDGWIVRRDLIWHKKNPMPEPVAGWRFEQESCNCATERREAWIAEQSEARGIGRNTVHGGGYGKAGDVPPDPDCPHCEGTGKIGEPVLKKGSWRHTSAHEYLFLLVKDMQYWCNQEAVREAVEESTIERNQYAYKGAMGRHVPNENRGYRELPPGESAFVSGRNPRSVVNIATAQYSAQHFATYPPELIAPLIRSGTPRYACPECGQGWAPVIEKGKVTSRGGSDSPDRGKLEVSEHLERRRADGSNASQFAQEFVARETHVKEYRPTCEHEHTKAEAVPGIVFDPFIGSGTTGMVARELQRRWIGADLSMEYLDQNAKIRTRTGSPSGQLENLPLFDSDAID